MSNPMLDREFLRQLDSMKHREIYARLTSLTQLEAPIEYIEGRVTGGSINLDGASSSRRTCNLTLVAKDVNINQFYWGLTHKFKVEIGIVNTINPKYEHIIWFNQGKFVITNFNVALNATSYTITINGKDKMSLLNGDLGGSMTAQTDFASIDVYDDFYELKIFNDPTTYVAGKYYTCIHDDVTNQDKYIISYSQYDKNQNYYQPSSIYKKESIPLKTIIREAVHTYGKEPYFNIIINDLEDVAVELLEYRGSTPLYLLLDKNQDIYTNMTLNGDIQCYADGIATTLSGLQPEQLDRRVGTLDNQTITVPATITFSGNNQSIEYYVSKIEYGQTAGFRSTELVYAGELIANVGESLTSVLDKIKNMLGDFEYFYDIDGRFIFQKQKVYQSESWNSITNTEDDDILIEDAVENLIGSSALSSAVTYSFIDNNIVTAFNNTPNLNNLKNDYSIWGIRKGISGADIPIHLRYAIDKKPTYYKSFDDVIYTTSEDVYESIKQDMINKITKDFYSFDKRPNPHYANKEQLPDDWWYMSDWFNYYKQLTGQEPNENLGIRFFATNRTGDPDKPQGYVENFDPNLYFDVINPSYLNKKSRIWLFHLKDNKYEYGNSDQHNSLSATSTLPETSDGTVTISPFASCGHKYNFFVEVVDGVAYDKPNATGFFYKPDFPQPNIEEIITEQLNQTIEEYVSTHFIYCDWREIIYQMSVDYFKHNQEDDFYSRVMLNNGRDDNGDYRYPNGSTGYEQYYTDINAFWRQLYDLDPKQDYYKQGGYYAETINWSKADDTTFEKETVWVPYEENDAIFESNYYIPTEKKKYKKDESIEQMINIENINIRLQPRVESNVRGIKWYEEYEDLELKYEIYSSFYASSGFSQVPNASYTPPRSVVDPDSGEIKTEYTFHEYRVTSSSLGPDDELKMYYRIRGYKDINVSGQHAPVRVYTQWSNKCWLWFKNEKTIEEGQVIGQPSLTVVDSHEFVFTQEDETPMITLDVYKSNFTDNNSKKFWNKQVFESPETLNFWFDFLDSDSELAQFSVPAVGDRPKAVNDSKVTSIYFKDIPNIIFTTSEEYNPANRETGYTYIWLDSSLMNMFSISTQQKSAKDALDEYLYQCAYCIENITITTLPIYYLEPNTRIFVYDEDSKINGEYIVSKITLPLAYNGTMTITANKAVNRIY